MLRKVTVVLRMRSLRSMSEYGLSLTDTCPKEDFQALERQVWVDLSTEVESLCVGLGARGLSAFSGFEDENLGHKQGMVVHPPSRGDQGR